MPSQQPARRRSSHPPVSIPDKLYFRIGDVARLCSLPAYVLRFWETEFPQLKPNKGGTGQRLYRKRDIEVVLEIKRLLYDEGFTIPGARRLLAEHRRNAAGGPTEIRPATEDRGDARRARQLVVPAEVLPARKAALEKSKIHALREEIRELLVLLGSNPMERVPSNASAARVVAARSSKKGGRPGEPTLF